MAVAAVQAGIINRMIKLFVGLGNPGAEYDATRHNAGFWFVDALARELKCALTYDKSYFGMVARTVIAGQTVWLLQPQTFMNLSGKSVGALAKFFKIASDEILVAHDELDIVPGEAKIKLGGSHAGHNGLRDIHAQLGTDQYWRLRIGIGHPGIKSEVIHWVLKKPSAEHRDAIAQTIERSVQALPHFLSGNMEKAMMTVHTSKPPRPKPPRPVPAPAPAPTLPDA
jgi:peptidyl-tRNA hydrolase, PTH1 family